MKKTMNSQKEIIVNPLGDDVSVDYAKIPPSTSASETISSSGSVTTFNLPNKFMYLRGMGLKFNFAATSTTASVNTILTLTQSGALAAGTFCLRWVDPFTGRSGITAPIAYDAAVGTVKAALELLEEFRGQVTFNATFAAGAAVTATFSGVYSGMPIPLTSLSCISSANETSATTVSTAGNGICLDRSALPLIERIRVTFGGVDAISPNDTGLYMQKNINTKMSREDRLIYGPEFGLDRQDRLMIDAAAGVDYFIPLHKFFNIFKQSFSLSASPVSIEISWEQPSKCLYTNGSTAGLQYTISAMEIQYEYARGYKEDKVLQIPYTRVYSNKSTVSSNVTSFNHKIDFAAKSATSFTGLLLETSDITDATVWGKMDKYHNSSITQYQFTLNGQEYPSKPVKCNGNGREAFRHLMRGLKPGEKPGFSIEQYNSTITDESVHKYELGYSQGEKFMIHYPFTLPFVQKEKSHKHFGFGAKLDTNGQNNLLVEKDAVATAYTFFAFLEVDCVLVVSDGEVMIRQK